MHGRIPHRLPAAHLLGDGEADEAAERAAGGGGSIDEADELRSDFASPDSEGSGGASSSSSAHEKDSTAAGEAEAEAGSGERNLTEHTGEGGSAATEATAGAEEKEEQATTTAAAAAAGNAAPTSSTSTSKPAPRPSWPPPRRPKKTYSQLQLPSPEQMAQEEAMNNCGVRTALSGVMGAGLGVVFGIFMGTMDMAGPQAGGPLPPPAAGPPVVPSAAAVATGAAASGTGAAATPPPTPPMTTPPKQSIREVLRATALSTKQRCVSYSKGFGAMGALFAGSECVIEKARAKHDIYNAVYAGCAAGGALAASGGIKAAGFGCVSFAAFSAFIEKVMQHD